MFNEMAQKYYDILTEGRTYIFKGGKVGIANKRFTTIPNDYSLTFDTYSLIEETNDN